MKSASVLLMSIHDGCRDPGTPSSVSIVTESRCWSLGDNSAIVIGVDLTEFVGCVLSVNLGPAIVFTIADKTTIST